MLVFKLDIIIREGMANDMQAVLDLIKELDEYEKAAHEVEMTLERLTNDGFGSNNVFNTIVAEQNDVIVGFALYYTGYSTWKGRTLYLEDFLVQEKMRGKGVGKLLFEETIKIAKRTGAQRMDWQVLDWNEPAIEFYKKVNATLDSEWINGRLLFIVVKKIIWWWPFCATTHA